MNLKNALKLSLLLSLFWAMIAVLGFTGVVADLLEIDVQPHHVIRGFLYQFFSVLIVNFAIFCFQFSSYKKEWKFRKKFWIAIAGSMLIVIFYFTLIGIIFHTIREVPYSEIFIYPKMLLRLIVATVITAMTMLMTSILYMFGQREKAIAEKEKTVVENQKLTIENMRARFETLKGQINPHFLFNSLNSLNALIELDAEKAKEFVHQLSSIFRYSIQNRETATLNNELDFTKTYCNMMKIRYGNSLIIDYRIDETYKNYLIIPLSLQMLAENAIKHNTISNRNPLTITIETTNNHTVKVWNMIQPKREDTTDDGVGLANISERYRMLYQKEIHISDTNGIFSVEIPLIKP